ncbi:MAG: AraC family transcriptional regulator [Sphingobacteriales bacterium]|nr:MAG: AraC family transcriptional regulator [Sphingobacteriales bacterium]
METKSIEDFYKETCLAVNKDVDKLLPAGIQKEIGHFNVFSVAELIAMGKRTGAAVMPYNRRTYYKISLVSGRNTAEYADKVVDIDKHALLFATPKVPYHWVPKDDKQTGHFCVFTPDFLLHSKSGVVLDDLPIFRPGTFPPIFQLNAKEAKEVRHIFDKMHEEITGSYTYKYDLLRNYVLELVHYGQKLQPVSALYSTHNASARTSSLFIELMERQFPIESQQQRLGLRTAKDYADRLSVHVNHLNKVLKENTGHTTTELISNRIAQEAKVLLKQTDWNVTEIAYTLGFDEVAHFSNFFKKQTDFGPLAFRA